MSSPTVGRRILPDGVLGIASTRRTSRIRLVGRDAGDQLVGVQLAAGDDRRHPRLAEGWKPRGYAERLVRSVRGEVVPYPKVNA